ncbi:MAG: branched-chain amino acid ABC transporter substrate-binding protein [Burkholderiales bacterium]
MNFRLLTPLLILAVGLTAAACGKKDSAENQNEVVVKIGSVSPLTGPQSHLGKDNENGARMAVDEANTQNIMLGGKKAKFVLVSEDDAADPKTATIVAQKLADQKINGVIGHLNSGTSIPASRIYHDAGIPQISPSATAIKYTAQGYNTAFRVMTNDAQQGHVLGQFAVTKMGAKKIAIIDDRSAYGQGLADEVEKAAKAVGAEIVAREYTTDKSTDFTAILTSIKSKNPDLIFFGGMDPQAAPMVQQMRRLGLGAQFLGGDGVQTTEFLHLAGADGEGVTASNPGVPLASMPGGKAFEQKFNAKYGKIQNYAPYAYDAVQVMIAAMRRADSADPAKYLPELAKTDFNGVTGHIQFDAKGDLTNGSVTLYRVEHGKWVPLETVRNDASPAPR